MSDTGCALIAVVRIPWHPDRTMPNAVERGGVVEPSLDGHQSGPIHNLILIFFMPLLGSLSVRLRTSQSEVEQVRPGPLAGLRPSAAAAR